jgi:Flp pilus assembly protein TadD
MIGCFRSRDSLRAASRWIVIARFVLTALCPLLTFAPPIAKLCAQTAEQSTSPSSTTSGPDLAVEQQGERPSLQETDESLKSDVALIERGELTHADKDLRDYLALHPDSAEAHFLLGYVLYREARPTDSLAEYTAGARFRKPEANDLASVAMDYVLLRDYADADKWLTMAVSWQPRNALYWYYLGRTRYTENRFQDAINAFDKALELSPRDVRAEYNLGLSYDGLNRDSDAAAAYRTAIDWEQGSAHPDSQPYLDLGILLSQHGQMQAALPYLEKAVSLDGDNPKAHEELGRAQEQLHNFAHAQAEMEKAVALAPNISSLHFELGHIYQKQGLTDRAKMEFSRCAALNAAHSTDATATPNP